MQPKVMKGPKEVKRSRLNLVVTMLSPKHLPFIGKRSIFHERSELIWLKFFCGKPKRKEGFRGGYSDGEIER
jgi:hypothetical protein